MFDLEASITNWKSTLAATRALSPDDIAELESHLRDSLDHLAPAKLSPEESFLLATRRIGHPAALSLDYTLAHPHRLWRDRALWMLTGLLAFQVASAVGDIAARLGLLTGALTGLQGDTLAVASLAFTLLGYAVAITLLILAWRRARTGQSFRPTPWIIAAVSFLLLEHLAGHVGWAVAAHIVPPNDLGRAATFSAFAGFAWYLLLPIALGLTLLRLRRQPAAHAD